MKILFIGDSITKGKLGESFVKIIARNNPGFRIKNLGNDGETLNAIAVRLVKHLKVESDYDYIVLQGGYNDLLLPTFKNRGSLFNFAYKHQLKKGMLPLTDSERIISFYKKLIGEIKNHYSGKIIIPTLGCLGENLSSDLNQQRISFNQSIKKLTEEENIILVDVGKEFDSCLESKQQSNYCLDNFWAVSLFDYFTWNTSKLSTHRKLFLTIDGVHLNKTGAEFFANTISKKLMS